jgi:hypothetical protein
MSRTDIPTTSVTEVTATPENKTTFNHYKHYQITVRICNCGSNIVDAIASSTAFHRNLQPACHVTTSLSFFNMHRASGTFLPFFSFSQLQKFHIQLLFFI